MKLKDRLIVALGGHTDEAYEDKERRLCGALLRNEILMMEAVNLEAKLNAKQELLRAEYEADMLMMTGQMAFITPEAFFQRAADKACEALLEKVKEYVVIEAREDRERGMKVFRATIRVVKGGEG